MMRLKIFVLNYYPQELHGQILWSLIFSLQIKNKSSSVWKHWSTQKKEIKPKFIQDSSCINSKIKTELKHSIVPMGRKKMSLWTPWSICEEFDHHSFRHRAIETTTLRKNSHQTSKFYLWSVKELWKSLTSTSNPVDKKPCPGTSCVSINLLKFDKIIWNDLEINYGQLDIDRFLNSSNNDQFNETGVHYYDYLHINAPEFTHNLHFEFTNGINQHGNEKIEIVLGALQGTKHYVLDKESNGGLTNETISKRWK